MGLNPADGDASAGEPFVLPARGLGAAAGDEEAPGPARLHGGERGSLARVREQAALAPELRQVHAEGGAARDEPQAFGRAADDFDVALAQTVGERDRDARASQLPKTFREPRG